MAQRDVELRVRAKAQTDKSLERLSGILREIEKDGADSVKGLNKSSDAVRAVGTEINRLQTEIGKLKAFDKLVVEVQKSNEALATSKKQLKDNAAEFAALARQQDAAGQAAVRYRAQMESEKQVLADLKSARKADADALAKVERDLARAGKALDTYNAKLVKAGKDPATDSGSIARGAALSTLGAARDQLQSSVGNFDAEIAQVAARLADYTEKTKAADSANAQLTKQVSASQAALTAQRVQVEANEASLDGATAAAHRASAALGGVAADQAAISAATDRATSELNQQRAALERISNAERELAERRRQSNFEGRDALTITQRIKAEVLALVTAYIGLNGALQSITNAIDTTRQLEAAGNRLASAFDNDFVKVGEEMDFVRGTADRLGIAMTELSASYSRFAVSAMKGGLSAESVRTVFLRLAETGRVNNLTSDQMNAVFTAMTQIMNKGKFTAEELQNQLGERLPAAVALMAQALGVTTAELNKMMEQGQVLATEETVLAFANAAGEMFGKQLPAALQSLSAEMGRFENDLDKVALAFAEGVIPGVREALNSFNAFVNSTAGQEFFVNLGTAVGQAVQAIGWLIENFETLYQIGTTLIGLAIGAKIGGWVIAVGTFAQSILAARGAMTLLEAAAYRMGVAVSVAGGPWTVLIAAVVAAGAVVATFWAGSKIGADEATLAMSEHQRQVNAVNEAYQTAADKTGAWADNIKNVTKTEVIRNQQRQIELYNQKVDELVSSVSRWRQEAANPRFLAGLPNERSNAIAIVQLTDALKEGKISIQVYREQLDRIYQSSGYDAIKDMAGGLLEATAASDETGVSLQALSDAITMGNALLKGMNGDWSEYEALQEGAKKSTDDTTKSLTSGANALDAYGTAIDEMKSKIPSLADDMKRLKEETEMTALAWTAINEAIKSGDYSKIAEVLGLLGRFRLEQNAGAVDSAVGGSLVDRIVGVESSGNPNAQPLDENGVPKSSALGLGQFIESTWLRMFKQYYPEIAAGMTDAMILAKRTDAELSRNMIELYARENAAVLQKAGVAINDANLYLAHFLGPGGASKLLTASPDTPVSDILGADQIAANRSILEGKTAGQVTAWAQGKMGQSDAQLAGAERLNEIEQDRLETAREQSEATANRIQDLQFEVDQQTLINAGREKQAAIEAAIRDAKADNPNITEAELAAIEELTAKTWELANAKSAITLEEEKVNNLMAMRSELEAQLEMAKEAGDTTLAATLGQDLTNINAEITAAIDNLIRMWEAAGGPEADLAIAKLRTAKMEVGNVKNETTKLGLTANTWSNIIGNMVNGVVNAFDAMAQAIANGENAAKAFGTAMLQMFAQLLRDIALAIIKQMILNALLGFTGGKGTFFGDILIGLGAKGHTGGLVGGSAIGAGNSLSSGMSAWRSGLSYHTGGIAGLKPDEVSATLRVNEEILTEDDPRHRFNLGGESAPAQSGIRQVLAIGDSEVANAMSGRAGEKTILTVLRRNVPTLKQMLK